MADEGVISAIAALLMGQQRAPSGDTFLQRYPNAMAGVGGEPNDNLIGPLMYPAQEGTIEQQFPFLRKPGDPVMKNYEELRRGLVMAAHNLKYK